MFEPGTGWTYGAGFDWAGKMIERRTGESLETYMSKNIWRPLGIKDITFWPKERADMQHRMASFSTLDPSGSRKAVDLPDFDISHGATDCIGGGGAYYVCQLGGLWPFYKLS
jgi:CubicO group peptidase (beta-lactamase class C family)